MSSLRQIAANHINGAKSHGPVTPAGKAASAANSARSTGPTTPEGKARSSRNALRHGILAESILLDGESPDKFNEVFAYLFDELQPAPGIETRYVETMALAEWRRMRLVCAEKVQLTLESRRQELKAAAHSPQDAPPGNPDATVIAARAWRALCDESRVQELLNRFEARHDRQFQRAFNGLRNYRLDCRGDSRSNPGGARRGSLNTNRQNPAPIFRPKPKKAKTRNEVNPIPDAPNPIPGAVNLILGAPNPIPDAPDQIPATPDQNK